jgi:HK97 gp10 family phage protein
MLVKVRGLRELHDALEKLPVYLRAGPIRSGMKAGAEVLQTAQAQMAPRNPVQAGVTLAEEIVTDLTLGETAAIARIGPTPKAFYARFLEFGTVKMRAQSFLRPALIRDGQIAIAALATHLKAGLVRAAKQARKPVHRLSGQTSS